MKKELDEDVFDAIKEMAEQVDLGSRNYNHELIAVDYYKNIHVLTQTELEELEQLWREKSLTCLKELLASRWMVVQVIAIVCLVIYIAWHSGGPYPAIIASVLGLFAMVSMLGDNRVRKAKKNQRDAKQVHTHLSNFIRNSVINTAPHTK